ASSNNSQILFVFKMLSGNFSLFLTLILLTIRGESVKLTCRYQTAETGVFLYWYKHHSDLEAPQFILMKGAKSWSASQYIPDNRYESRTSDASTELTIKSLTLADTALYYCLILVIHCGSLGHNELLPLFTILGNMENYSPNSH
uniref:Ig-like domain-containing protein n=1 Tax=Mastacembelus armatus TaxID=205130 RepID=A0A3Q3MKK8_9TELE